MINRAAKQPARIDRKSFSLTRALVCVLVCSLLVQTTIPPALAAPRGSHLFPGISLLVSSVPGQARVAWREVTNGAQKLAALGQRFLTALEERSRPLAVSAVVSAVPQSPPPAASGCEQLTQQSIPYALAIDADSIDKGAPPNNFSDKDVNKDIAEIGVRTPLRYFAAHAGSEITLHTGQVGDEGWFAIKHVPLEWVSAGPTTDGLRNFFGNPATPFPHGVGPGLGTPDANGNREALLDKIPDVTPLRATALKRLEGRRVMAVVFDSDVSINYSPVDGSYVRTDGSLKGKTLGTVAFEVIEVAPLLGYSSSSLPKVRLRILDVTQFSQSSFLLFSKAPTPVSSSQPFDTIPPPTNHAPVVNAGGDQEVIGANTTADLNGSISDDGLPSDGAITTLWTQVSGPAPAQFANAQQRATSVSFPESGVYVFQLSASDDQLCASDEIVITVLKNQPPVVDAGPDQIVTLPAGTNLNGVVTDDGLPIGSTLEIRWELVNGPAPVIFNDAFVAATPITFTVAGIYLLRLSASDSEFSASDELTIEVRPKTFIDRTYTLDADFDQGTTFNVTHAVANQLQLDHRAREFDFLWVAVSSKGTIVKIDTKTGQVIGEYLTSPSGQPKDPSRTTVDLNGNVWATNRAGNSVVHIGLVENGQCVDRNGNGVIDTSTGFNDIRAWPNTGGANTNGGVSLAADECIIHYTKVNSFGTRHVSVNKDNDVWVSGTSGRRFDLLDGVTGQIKRAEPTVGFGGYGGLIDPAGVIWSSNPMLRWNTSLPLTGPNGGNWRGFSHPSYGLCIDSQGNVWNTSFNGGGIRKFAPDGTLLGTFNQGNALAQGCVVDKNDHVWVAHSLNRSTVGHLKNDGSLVGVITVGSGPTGVAVDGAGKIWATNFNSRTVSRIDPNAGPLGPDGVTRVGAVDFTTINLGGSLYNYSDMTGSTLSGIPNAGTWSTVFDSQIVGAEWGKIGWTARICGDASLTVSVASSTDGTTFGPAEVVTNGADPSVANGRFLRIIVNFKRSASGESPILYDLSVGTSGFTLPVVANEAPTAFAGGDQTVTLPDAAKLSGTACDDGFPRGASLALTWSKVSGPGEVAFTKPNSPVTDATFTVAGTYVLRLTASDSEHTASDEVTVTALPANAAPIVNAGPNQTITLPNTASLNGTVADDGFPVGATVNTFWSQLSGPGLVTFNEIDNPVTKAILSTPGTYVLRLSANDTHRIGTDDIQITVNAAPALTGATLQLAAAAPGPYVTGTLQSVHATLRNSAGNPLANFGVEFTVSGPNATTGSAVTNTSGIATFSYAGTNPGTDTVTALVRSTATANIDGTPPVSMGWTLTPQSPPVTQGWIGGPLNNATITGSLPITVGAGVTLTNAKVEYWPVSNPAAVTTLVEGAQGGPGATLATFDATTLANGNYVIRLTATDQNGQEQISQVMITVAGENKPGRMTVQSTDLIVPVTGLPITIARKYDSLDRNEIGDFGHGWSLELAGPRLEVSPDNDVTVTEPGTGRRVTFQFTPTAFPFPFSFFYQPTYTPEPGVFGKLVSNGCGLLVRSNNSFVCFLSLEPSYNPTAFAYTDPYGRVYTMTAAGKMLSIKDLNNNLVTFTDNGITSSAGNLTVPFVRDSQGRITEITDPTGKVYRYNYDTAGDLTSVVLPEVTNPLRYEYDPGHFFRKGFDARGNAEATTTYYPDGRIQSFTDAMGRTTSYSYDLVNNITTITHPDNSGTTVQRFDSNGLLLSQTDPLNHTTTYTYDANRNKLTETNALQQTTTNTYDARGNVTSVTDSVGKTLRWTYNQFGTVATATDQLGNVQTTQFDANFNPVSVVDSLGIRAAFTWDAHGNPLTTTDGNGKVTRMTYDAFGNVLTRTDPLNRITSYTYDGMGRAVTMTDPRGGVTRFTHDALGRLLTVTDPLNQVTTYEYDPNGNRTAQVDAAGRRTTYEYDAANRLTKVNNPDSTSINYTYNFRGQRLTETDQEGHTTSHVYDNAGRLIKTLNLDLTEITYAYDAIDRVISVTDELNRTTRFEYDQSCGCSERLAKVIDALNQVTTYTFDAAGRTTSLIDANQHETRFDYDVRGMLTRTTYADGKTTSQTYDGTGHVLTEVDQANRTTRFGYDEVGNLTSVSDVLNQTTENSYDVLNNLRSTTDALGRSTRFEYDALNRVIKRVLPLGMAELYTYDQVGNRVTRTDFRGKQTNYDYDSMNRLIRKSPDASLGEPAVSYTYTSTGERASMSDVSGTTLYTYDARHRLLSKQTPQGTLTYSYDAASKLASTRSSNPNGISVNYTYDTINRLESVIDNRLAVGTTTFAYDAVGNLLGATAANGVQTAYTYDTVDRVLQLTHSKNGGTLASYSHTLDPTGRRLSVTENNGKVVNYTYDALYRLTNEAVTGAPTASANGSVGYSYDAVGNRLSRISALPAILSATSAYDANDRLTSDSYDANGNTRSANGLTYAYDFENRIKSVNGGAVRIAYDGDGNRVSKTVGGVTTKYLNDDLNLTGYSQVAEELVDGTVQRVYTHGNRLISQSQQLNGNWQSSFYGLDGHGNVTFLTDSNGVVTDTYTYDAFGTLTSSTGSTPNNYLYNGQQFDPDLGFYFKRARYYNQDRGRFMTPDPHPGSIDQPMSLHKYMFAHADPVNRVDPCGTSATLEYALVQKQVSLRTVAAIIALGFAIACLFVQVATTLAPDIVVPPIYAACRRRGPRRCRCSIRMAPPDIMAQCPHRVFGTGMTLGECQRNAKNTAPQQCRRYYGHCGWIP